MDSIAQSRDERDARRASLHRELVARLGASVAAVEPEAVAALEVGWPTLALTASERVFARGDRWGIARAGGDVSQVVGGFFGESARFLRGVLVVRSARCLVDCTVWNYSHMLRRGVPATFLEEAHRAWIFVARMGMPESGRSLAQLFETILSCHEKFVELAQAASVRAPLQEPFRSYAKALGRALGQGDLRQAERAVAGPVARLRGAAELPLWWEQVITPVLRTVGLLWENGRIETSQEGVATAIVQRLLARHHPSFALPAVREPVAVAVPPGEQHDLGARLVRDTLRTFGHPTVFLPARSDARMLAPAVESVGKVYLSVSTPGSFRALEESVEVIRRNSEAEIVVGGRAFASDPEVWRELGCDRFVPDLGKLVEEAAAAALGDGALPPSGAVGPPAEADAAERGGP